MRKSAPRPKQQTDPLMEVFARMDGVEGMLRWSRNHRTQFYALFVKSAPPQAAGSINAITVDPEAARLALENALMRIVDARKYPISVASVEGELLPEMIEHAPRVIEHESLPRNGEPQSPAAATSPKGEVAGDGGAIERVIDTEPAARRAPPPAAAHVVPPRAEALTPAEARARAMEPLPQPSQSTQQSTQSSTASFIEWFNSGGGSRMRHSDWGPV
jgi:hypothetical protein